MNQTINQKKKKKKKKLIFKMLVDFNFTFIQVYKLCMIMCFIAP